MFKFSKPIRLLATFFVFAVFLGSYAYASSIQPEQPLEAQWVPNAVKITFNSNGGGTAPAYQIYTYGIERSLPGVGAMYKSGYNFIGWAESSDASTPDFAPGALSNTAFGFADATKAIAKTLYAVWQPVVGMHIPITYVSDGEAFAYVSTVTTTGWTPIAGSLSYNGSTLDDAIIGISRSSITGACASVDFNCEGAAVAYVSAITTTGFTPIKGTITYAGTTIDDAIIGMYKSGAAGVIVPTSFNSDGAVLAKVSGIDVDGWTLIKGTVKYAGSTITDVIIGFYKE